MRIQEWCCMFRRASLVSYNPPLSLRQGSVWAVMRLWNQLKIATASRIPWCTPQHLQSLRFQRILVPPPPHPHLRVCTSTSVVQSKSPPHLVAVFLLSCWLQALPLEKTATFTTPLLYQHCSWWTVQSCFSQWFPSHFHLWLSRLLDTLTSGKKLSRLASTRGHHYHALPHFLIMTILRTSSSLNLWN